LGPSKGGINCCLDKDNPAANVSIGYLTNEIKAGDTLGLTVEQADPACAGSLYSWAISEGPGELSAGSGLDVIYTAPATGHGCPGNVTITLSCGGAVMDTLVVTIDYEYAISFAYGEPELEIDRGNSLPVNVSANGTPLTWSVSGNGFTLEYEETEGTANVLYADATASGTATITITDCEGNIAIGYVRCTTGSWVGKTNDCQMPGAQATEVVTTPGEIMVIAIRGYQKQVNYYTDKTAGSGLQDSCEEAIELACGQAFDCLHFTLDCDAFCSEYPTLCADRVCRKGCAAYASWYYVDVCFAFPGTKIYYEWE